jgi:hypothetical protein
MPPLNNRDEIQFKIPMVGEVHARGRILVAVIFAVTFAAGLIVMQLWTYRQFQRDLDRMFSTLMVEVQQARQDRQDQRDALVAAGCLTRDMKREGPRQ